MKTTEDRYSMTPSTSAPPLRSFSRLEWICLVHMLHRRPTGSKKSQKRDRNYLSMTSSPGHHPQLSRIRRRRDTPRYRRRWRTCRHASSRANQLFVTSPTPIYFKNSTTLSTDILEDEIRCGCDPHAEFPHYHFAGSEEGSHRLLGWVAQATVVTSDRNPPKSPTPWLFASIYLLSR